MRATLLALSVVLMASSYVAKANEYAAAVVSGEIPACQWVRLACERQINDLQRTDWPYHFNEKRATDICEFVEWLPHVKGRWKTKDIVLEPWQCFTLTTIFGWVDDGGNRRFRKALVVVPRKNSKSTMAAGVGLYLLALDKEPGSEVYSAATTRDQAKICWDMARIMALRIPDLARHYGIDPLAHSIAVESTASFFKPLSRDADSLEGLNVHGAIIDELHAHPTREVFDVLNEATGSRRQPLLFIISTEGDSNEGVFAGEVAYLQGILSGNHQDENYFGVYYGLDKEDDWTLPAAWHKANPNLGASVFVEDMEIRCRQAMASPDSQASFLTKRLNVRVGAGSAYFNMLAWGERCKDASLKIEDFYGESCTITLDLASKRDLADKVYVFNRGPLYIVFAKHYLPEDAVQRGMPNYDFYRGWQKAGLLTVTDGNRTNYDLIEEDIAADLRNFRVLRVGVDPLYNAEHLTQRLTDKHGAPMEEVPQNVPTFSEPMKELDAMIVAGRIRHNGDPVLAWAMGNVVAKRDAKDNVYPRKARDENKIDPAVALIANMSLQLRLVEERSVYEDPATAVM